MGYPYPQKNGWLCFMENLSENPSAVDDENGVAPLRKPSQSPYSRFLHHPSPLPGPQVMGLHCPEATGLERQDLGWRLDWI